MKMNKFLNVLQNWPKHVMNVLTLLRSFRDPTKYPNIYFIVIIMKYFFKFSATQFCIGIKTEKGQTNSNQNREKQTIADAVDFGYA